MASEAQKRAVNKYVKAHYDAITIRVPKGKKEEYKAKADERGISLAQFIVQALDKELEN